MSTPSEELIVFSPAAKKMLRSVPLLMMGHKAAEIRTRAFYGPLEALQVKYSGTMLAFGAEVFYGLLSDDVIVFRLGGMGMGIEANFPFVVIPSTLPPANLCPWVLYVGCREDTACCKGRLVKRVDYDKHPNDVYNCNLFPHREEPFKTVPLEPGASWMAQLVNTAKREIKVRHLRSTKE